MEVKKGRGEKMSPAHVVLWISGTGITVLALLLALKDFFKAREKG